MKKASHELALHIAKFNHDQKPMVMDFIDGYFYKNKLYYVFRVTIREYLPDFLGVAGGYSSFDPKEKASILNAQYVFDLKLAHPLIRILNCNNEDIKDQVTLFYHATQKEEIIGPDNRLVNLNYRFKPSLSLDIETNSPSRDYSFSNHILDYKTIEPELKHIDASNLFISKFLFSHVLLKTSSFSVEDFIDCFEQLWSERLRPDNYNIRPYRLNGRLPNKNNFKKQNKHFTFYTDSGLTLTININNSAKFIKDYAKKYHGCLIEPNLKDFASKTHKTLQLTCISKKGTLIESTRFLVKAVTACCNLFNAQAVVTDSFVYKSDLYKEAALASLDASIDSFSWFPTFNIVGNKVKILHNHEQLCAATDGMNRFNLLDIFIPESRLKAHELVNVLNTLARASFEKKGNIANKRFNLKGLQYYITTSIERSTRTDKRYLMAKVHFGDEKEEEIRQIKVEYPKYIKADKENAIIATSI